MSVKFVFSPYTHFPIEDIVKWSVEAEKLGFDYVWLPDLNPSYDCNDTFITLAAIALATKKVIVGPSICNPYTRHPAMIARTIRTLYSISNGRVILGIGAGGGSALPPLCYEMWNKPIATVRDAVIAIRKLLRGEKLSMESYNFRVCNLQFKDEPVNVPIFIGARRPQMLTLSGKIADGVIFGSCSEKMIDCSKKYVMRGLKKAGRDPSNFSIANWMYSSISEDSDEAKEFVKPHMPAVIYREPMEILKEAGHETDVIIKIYKLMDEGKSEQATNLITDDIINDFSLTGTPEEIIKKIRRMVDLGVTHIVFGYPLGKDIEKALKLIGNEVIPVFKK
ncbi:MAG: LLM class flavin-dependent oxidoreductase [Candidatus Asgardarchaeum sp.]